MGENTGNRARILERLGRLSEYLKHIRSILVNASVIIIVIPVVIYLVVEGFKTKINVSPIPVPDILVKQGYNEDIIRSRLGSRVSKILQTYKNILNNQPFSIELDENRYRLDYTLRGKNPISTIVKVAELSIEDREIARLHIRQSDNNELKPAKVNIKNLSGKQADPDVPGINMSLTEVRTLIKAVINRQDGYIKTSIRYDKKSGLFHVSTLYIDPRSRIYTLPTLSGRDINELITTSALDLVNVINPLAHDTYLLYLSKTLYQRRYYRRALLMLKRLSRRHQDNPGLCHFMGRAYQKTGQNDVAERHFKRCLDIMETANGYFRLAQSLTINGKHDEAINELKKMLKRYKSNGNRAKYHNLTGYNLVKTGMLDEAVQYFRKAIAIDKQMVVAYTNLAYVYRKQNKLRAALSIYKRAALLGRNTDQITLLIASTLGNMKHHAEANTYLEKLTHSKSRRNRYHSHFMLSRNYYQMHDFQRAKRHAIAAQRYYPWLSAPYRWIGYSDYKLGLANRNRKQQIAGLQTALRDVTLSTTDRNNIRKTLEKLTGKPGKDSPGSKK